MLAVDIIYVSCKTYLVNSRDTFTVYYKLYYINIYDYIRIQFYRYTSIAGHAKPGFF